MKRVMISVFLAMTAGTTAADDDADRTAVRERRTEAETLRIEPNAVLVPRSKSVRAGALVVIDVFLGTTRDLRGYQIAVDTRGTQAGVVTVDEMTVDTLRPDYALRTTDVIAAADLQRTRMGSVRMAGSVDLEDPAYIGTFTLRVSDDADGVLAVTIRRGQDSFWLSSGNERRPLVSKPAYVRVVRPVRKVPRSDSVRDD